MLKFLQRVIPPEYWTKIRQAVLFRPEDPNQLIQILPQREVYTQVERIKGFRYPAPGSRMDARIPLRESEDEIYNTSYYSRDPRNLPNENKVLLNSNEPVLLDFAAPKYPISTKRKVTLLAYDNTGLRTTKTTSWDAVNKSLASHTPNHLPRPSWWAEYDQMVEDRIKKDLPPPVGKRHRYANVSSNYNEVRW